MRSFCVLAIALLCGVIAMRVGRDEETESSFPGGELTEGELTDEQRAQQHAQEQVHAKKHSFVLEVPYSEDWAQVFMSMLKAKGEEVGIPEKVFDPKLVTIVGSDGSHLDLRTQEMPDKSVFPLKVQYNMKESGGAMAEVVSSEDKSLKTSAVVVKDKSLGNICKLFEMPKIPWWNTFKAKASELIKSYETKLEKSKLAVKADKWLKEMGIDADTEDGVAKFKDWVTGQPEGQAEGVADWLADKVMHPDEVLEEALPAEKQSFMEKAIEYLKSYGEPMTEADCGVGSVLVGHFTAIMAACKGDGAEAVDAISGAMIGLSASIIGAGVGAAALPVMVVGSVAAALPGGIISIFGEDDRYRIEIKNHCNQDLVFEPTTDFYNWGDFINTDRGRLQHHTSPHGCIGAPDPCQGNERYVPIPRLTALPNKTNPENVDDLYSFSNIYHQTFMKYFDEAVRLRTKSGSHSWTLYSEFQMGSCYKILGHGAKDNGARGMTDYYMEQKKWGHTASGTMWGTTWGCSKDMKHDAWGYKGEVLTKGVDGKPTWRHNLFCPE